MATSVTIPSQTVTVPPQTVTLPAPTLPAGMTFDGTTLTVPAIHLTSGAALADGLYMASVKAGVMTWVPVQTVTLPAGVTGFVVAP